MQPRTMTIDHRYRRGWGRIPTALLSLGVLVSLGSMSGCSTTKTLDASQELAEARFLLGPGPYGTPQLLEVDPSATVGEIPVTYAERSADGTIKRSIRVWTRVGGLAEDIPATEVPAENGNLVVATSPQWGWYVHADLEGCPGVELYVEPRPGSADEVAALGRQLRCQRIAGSTFDRASLSELPDGYQMIISPEQAARRRQAVDLVYGVGGRNVSLHLESASTPLAMLGATGVHAVRAEQIGDRRLLAVEGSAQPDEAVAAREIGFWIEGWWVSLSLDAERGVDAALARQLLRGVEQVSAQQWRQATEELRPAPIVLDEIPAGWHATVQPWSHRIELSRTTPGSGTADRITISTVVGTSPDAADLPDTPASNGGLDVSFDGQPMVIDSIEWTQDGVHLKLYATVAATDDPEERLALARAVRVVDDAAWRPWATEVAAQAAGRAGHG